MALSWSRYRLVTPAIGIESYVASMDVDTQPNFAALFEQEIAYLQDHFTK